MEAHIWLNGKIGLLNNVIKNFYIIDVKYQRNVPALLINISLLNNNSHTQSGRICISAANLQEEAYKLKLDMLTLTASFFSFVLALVWPVVDSVGVGCESYS